MELRSTLYVSAFARFVLLPADGGSEVQCSGVNVYCFCISYLTH